MKNNIKSAVSLTGYFFSLPPAHFFMIGMLALSILFGLAINFGKYSGIELLRVGVIDGFLLLGLPAFLSTAVMWIMIRKTPIKRIVAVSFTGELIYAFAYLASLLLTDVNTFVSELTLLVGAAIVFVLWYAIARLVFLLKYRAILFAIVQLLFYLAFMVNSHVFMLSNEPINSITKFYVASFILFGAVYIFFLIINAPMKKNFGFSSTDAISLFVSQWLYKNKDLEKAFEAVGSRVRTLVTIMGFEKENGKKIFFVNPLVHFGPFGNLGGSEFSWLISDELERKYKADAFVFHGTVTHDLNPVSASQMEHIIAACDDCIANSKFVDSQVSYLSGKESECRAQGLMINKSALIGLSRAPYVTEDINLGLGLMLMKEAEKKVDIAMVIDQHNAETGEITSFEPGDIVGYNYMKSIEDALSTSVKSKSNKLKIGIARRDPVTSVLGKAGIKIAAISSSPEHVIILIDSNGVTPEFRDSIEAKVKSLGKSMGREFVVGICTTDTHQTNMVRGVLNPMHEEDAILNDILSGVEEAAKNMSNAKFFSAKKWFDIDVIGAKQSIEIISTVNSIVAVAKITLPLILIGALLLLFAVLTRI